MLETVLCNIRTIAAFYEITLAHDGTYDCDNAFIYNPQGPRGPRRFPALRFWEEWEDFNPQGPRGPRHQSFPQGNGQMINAQAVVDNIAGWLEDIENLPKLTENRTITKFTANESFPDVEEVEGDKATVFAVNAIMQYEKKGT